MRPVVVASLILAQAISPTLRVAVAPVAPVNSPVLGVVLLSVMIDRAGNLQNVSTLYGAPPFVGPSLNAIRRWKFASSSDPSLVRSISITFLYRPRQIFSAGGMSLPALGSATPRPSLPSTISDSGYPVNSVAEDSVILELKISADGQIEQIQNIRDVPALTGAARRAVGAWKFSPAFVDGMAVEGTSIAVVSFLRPVVQ
jgi:outer membrane biosynthesis protein TonB